MNFKLSDYMLISDPLDGQNLLQSKRLVFSTRKGMGVTLSNYVISLMESGQFDALPDNIFNILMYHELVIPEDEVELEEVIKRAKATASDIYTTQRVFYLDADVLEEDPDWWLEELAGSGFLESDGRRLRKKLVFVIDTEVQDKAMGLLAGIREEIRMLDPAVFIRIEVHLLHRHRGLVPLYGKEWAEVWPIQHVHLLWDLRGSKEEGMDLGPKEMTSFLAAAGKEKTGVDILLLIDPNQFRALEPLLQEVSRLLPGISGRLFLNWGRGERPDLGKTANPETDKEIAALLGFLQASPLNVDILPGPAFTYRGRQIGPSLTPSGRIVWDQTLLPVYDPLPVPGTRRPYDADIADTLRNRKSKCGGCVYLPLCGGKLDKAKADDRDCPPFVERFWDHVKLKYKIPF